MSILKNRKTAPIVHGADNYPQTKVNARSRPTAQERALALPLITIWQNGGIALWADRIGCVISPAVSDAESPEHAMTAGTAIGLTHSCAGSLVKGDR